jgi:hypothetical protein
MRRAAAGAMALAVAAGISGAPVASAAPAPPGCVEQFWMIGLRATNRTICDGPLAPDGSWMRARSFTAPAFVADGISVCYSNSYCTFSLPRQVAAYDVRDTYRVTPETVLADEPPYVGIGGLA